MPGELDAATAAVAAATAVGAAAGGGGGGGGATACGGGAAAAGAAAPGAGCCRKKSTMKSWLSRINSSVRPLARRSSPKCSRQLGSKASSVANSEGGVGPRPPLRLPDRP